MSTQGRKRYLINPRLQLGAVAVLLGTGGLYVLLQASLLFRAITQVSESSPEGTELLNELLPILRFNLMVTMLVIVPFTLAIGIFMTHKVVGPLYRFEQYLQQLVRGEKPGPCKLRDGDELQHLCELLNEATKPMRESRPRLVADPGDDQQLERAG